MSSIPLYPPPSYDTLPTARTNSNGLTKAPSSYLTATPCAINQDPLVGTLAIPTAGPALSSSFSYHPALADFNVSPADWCLFTADLQAATAPTKGQKALAVLGGIGTAVVIGGPWASLCVWRCILRKQIIGSVKKGLKEIDDAGCGKTETVGAVLKRWNVAWADKGIVLSLSISEKGVNVDHAIVPEGVVRTAVKVNDPQRAKKCCGGEKRRFEQKGRCCATYSTYLMVVIQKVGEAVIVKITDEKTDGKSDVKLSMGH